MCKTKERAIAPGLVQTTAQSMTARQARQNTQQTYWYRRAQTAEEAKRERGEETQLN
jgi:hypothetical protein